MAAVTAPPRADAARLRGELGYGYDTNKFREASAVDPAGYLPYRLRLDHGLDLGVVVAPVGAHVGAAGVRGAHAVEVAEILVEHLGVGRVGAGRVGRLVVHGLAHAAPESAERPDTTLGEDRIAVARYLMDRLAEALLALESGSAPIAPIVPREAAPALDELTLTELVAGNTQLEHLLALADRRKPAGCIGSA